MPVVVVGGPDDRPTSSRGYEVWEHEGCQAKFKDHYVFVLPRSYGVKREKLAESGMQIENWDIWGSKGPLAVLRLQEAAIISRILLGRSFVFLSTEPAEGSLSQECYMIDGRDWWEIERIKKGFTSIQRVGTFESNPCRTLRVSISGPECGFTVCPVVIEKDDLAALPLKHTRLGTWQQEVWDASAGLIPDTEVEKGYRSLKPVPREYQNFARGITEKDKRRLLISALFTKWQGGDLLDSRGAELEKVSGKRVSRGNFRNELVDAGCLNPSHDLALKKFNSLRLAAKKMSTDADKMESMGIADVQALTRDTSFVRKLLAVVYPAEFGGACWSLEFGSPHWNMASVSGLNS